MGRGREGFDWSGLFEWLGLGVAATAIAIKFSIADAGLAVGLFLIYMSAFHPLLVRLTSRKE